MKKPIETEFLNVILDGSRKSTPRMCFQNHCNWPQDQRAFRGNVSFSLATSSESHPYFISQLYVSQMSQEKFK